MFLRNQDPSNPINPNSLFKSTMEELAWTLAHSMLHHLHTDTHTPKKSFFLVGLSAIDSVALKKKNAVQIQPQHLEQHLSMRI